MLCSKCGENLLEKAVFCPKCGAKTDTAVWASRQSASPQVQPVPREMSNTKQTLLAVGLLALIMGFWGLAVWAGSVDILLYKLVPWLRNFKR
jgi:uncharacterized membrane protein YvbJ